MLANWQRVNMPRLISSENGNNQLYVLIPIQNEKLQDLIGFNVIYIFKYTFEVIVHLLIDITKIAN